MIAAGEMSGAREFTERRPKARLDFRSCALDLLQQSHLRIAFLRQTSEPLVVLGDANRSATRFTAAEAPTPLAIPYSDLLLSPDSCCAYLYPRNHSPVALGQSPGCSRLNSQS
jgi:hypothetical protein